MRGSSRAHKKHGFGTRRKHRGYPGGLGRLFGVEVEGMSPRAQVAAALAVLVPVALSGLLLVALVPSMWWIFTTYGWVAFPAFGLLLRGLTGTPAGSARVPAIRAASAHDREKEILAVLRREGEITPIHAAMGTSLSVAEAEQVLRELAEGGHLEVRTRGGGLFYALWEAGEDTGRRGLEARIGHEPHREGAA